MSTRQREEQVRDAVVAASRALHQRGWVANHDGNISARLAGGRFVITPTAVSKGDVALDWLVTTDDQGAVTEGTRKPPSELQLHRAAWQARPDIGVVIHAHPPHATAFLAAGVPIPHPFLAEAAVSLGPLLPVVPWLPPGDAALGPAVGAALAVADVVLLDQHGVLSVGGDVEQALLRLELVEHLAGIAWRALPLGGVRVLDGELVARLCKGGRPCSQPDHSKVEAAAPPSSPVNVPVGSSGPRPDVRAVVEEARRRLG